jgi:lipopolysaccharide heptosyltransferase II
MTMARALGRRAYRAALRGLFALLSPAGKLGRLVTPPYDPHAVRRILVVRLGLLGDGTALLAPALRLAKLHFPQAEVHVLATPLQAPVLAPLPSVTRVIPWTAGDLTEPRQALRPQAWRDAARTIRDLRAQRFDLALACYGALASAIAFASGARYRFGYAGEALPGTLTHALPGGRYDRPWHEVHYSAALVAAAAGQPVAGGAPTLPWSRPASALPGAGTSADGPPDVPPAELHVTPAARQAMDRLLGNAGGSSRLAVFLPGATNGAAKRWPVAHWAALARFAAADGWQVVLAGGTAERVLSAEIAVRAGLPVLDVTGRTSVEELLALLERAGAVVAGDSGPMHLATALGRPVVAIHGPTAPWISGPFDRRRAVVVRRDLPCSPCYRLDRVADCPLGHTLCQWLVRPDEVYRAMQQVAQRAVAERP